MHLVCPGEFDSAMLEAVDQYRTQENRAHVQSVPKTSGPESVVDTLAGIRSGTFMIIPGRTTRMAAFVIRHLPALNHWLGDRIIARAQREQKVAG